MLDKSSLQSLSPKELNILRRYFNLVVPPVLLIEILGDLKKSSGAKGHPSAMSLARKIVPGASLPFLPKFQDLIKAELADVRVKMDFRPLVLPGHGIKSRTGERGTELQIQPEAEALMKWQQNQFEKAEELLAEQYRKTLKGMDVEALQRSLRKEYSSRINLQSLQETAEFVDDLIEGSEPEKLLRWFLNDAFGNEDLLSSALNKIPKGVRLECRLPYTCFCVRLSLIFHYALAFHLVSSRVSNRIDLEYLYYLPFTRGFSSGDKLHLEFFEIVGLEGNSFVQRDDLKQDLGRILKHEEQHPDSAEMVQPPDLDEDSFTSLMWRTLMKPVSKKRGELMQQLTPEQEEKLMTHVRCLMDSTQDNSGPPDEERDFLIRHYNCAAEAPCPCGSPKKFRDCHGKQQF